MNKRLDIGTLPFGKREAHQARAKFMRRQRLKALRWPLLLSVWIAIAPVFSIAPVQTLILLSLLGSGICFGSIEYPSAGAISYGQFTATDNSGLITQFKNALVTCGWIDNAISTFGQFHFPSVPDDGDSFSVGGQTYTFRTTVSAPNDISRSGSIVTNVFTALSGTGTPGVNYGSGTVANANIGAQIGTSNGVRFWHVTNGTSPNPSFVSTGAHITLEFGGYRMDMLATPQGLRASVWLENLGDDQEMRVRCQTHDGVFSADNSVQNGAAGTLGAAWLHPQAGRTFEFCGCAHQFAVFILSDSSTFWTQVFFTCPFLDAAKQPTPITGATNASPIVIEAVGHGVNDQQDVFIADVEGNVAANGFFTVTKVDDDHLSLNGSTGSGGYTSLTGLLAGPRQIARVMFLQNSGGTGNWRHQLANGFEQGWGVVNQYSRVFNDSGGPALDLPRAIGDNNEIVINWGEIGDLQEANISVRITGSGGSRLRVGRLWAAFPVRETVNIDRPVTGFDGHNWIQYLDGSVGANQSERVSLFFAKS